jgi:hypothetical protein
MPSSMGKVERAAQYSKFFANGFARRTFSQALLEVSLHLVEMQRC